MKKIAVLLVLFLAVPVVGQGLEERSGGHWVGHNGMVERAETRVAFFTAHPSGIAQGKAQVEGELMINFGRPKWKADYGKRIDEMTLGKVWRLGADFWTILDTNLDLSISGQTVPSGYYYLAVRRMKPSQWELLLLDPVQARQIRLDPFEILVPSPKTHRGLPVAYSFPLTHGKGAEVEEQLKISLKPQVEKSRTQVGITIAWGDLRLTTTLVPKTTS